MNYRSYLEAKSPEFRDQDFLKAIFDASCVIPMGIVLNDETPPRIHTSDKRHALTNSVTKKKSKTTTYGSCFNGGCMCSDHNCILTSDESSWAEERRNNYREEHFDAWIDDHTRVGCEFCCNKCPNVELVFNDCMCDTCINPGNMYAIPPVMRGMMATVGNDCEYCDAGTVSYQDKVVNYEPPSDEECDDVIGSRNLYFSFSSNPKNEDTYGGLWKLNDSA